MNYNKRQFLKTSALIGSAYITGTSSTKSRWFANLFNSKNNSNEVTGIPDQWVQVGGNMVYEYANYILGLNLRNITPRMVIESHFKCRGKTRNSLPPKSMWQKIHPTLEIVDAMTDVVGRPIDSIISAYRSPNYNQAVRGKSRSYHMQNQAVDVVFKNTSAWKVTKVARHLRDKEKEFKGGIGHYKYFTHIDTRGFNSNW